MSKLRKNIKKAIELFSLKAPKQAITLVEEEIKKYPQYVEAYEVLGDMHLHLEEPNKALPPLIWAIKLKPQSFLANFLLAIAYTKILKLDKAIIYFKKADKLKPNNAEIIRQLGWAICLKGDLKNGRELLEKAIKINPKDSLIYNDLASTYMLEKEQDFIKAEKWFKKALKIKPHHPLTQQTYQKFREIKQQADEEEKKITQVIGQLRSKTSKKSLENHDILEITPYNYCDGWCEKCKQQKICPIHQDRKEFKDKCLKEGKDPNNTEETFKNIELGFKIIKRMLEEDAKKMGVKIKPITKKELAEERALHRKITNSKLFKEATQFEKSCKKFLDKIFISLGKEPILGLVLEEEIKKLIHYSQLCEPKIYRALIQFEDENEITKDDGFRSMAIVLSSLNICQNTLGNIRETGKQDWALESLLLSSHIKQFKECLLKNYPQIGTYKNKIIINTK